MSESVVLSDEQIRRATSAGSELLKDPLLRVPWRLRTELVVLEAILEKITVGHLTVINRPVEQSSEEEKDEED